MSEDSSIEPKLNDRIKILKKNYEQSLLNTRTFNQRPAPNTVPSDDKSKIESIDFEQEDLAMVEDSVTMTLDGKARFILAESLKTTQTTVQSHEASFKPEKMDIETLKVPQVAPR